MKNAVLIMTHFLDQFIVDKFNRIRNEVPSGYDVFLLIHVESNEPICPRELEAYKDKIYFYTTQEILKLPYPARCNPKEWIDNRSFQVDLLLACFHKNNPGYDYYWGIEYDVHYEGRWEVFFERFERSAADLLGTMMGSAIKAPHVTNLLPPFHDHSGKRPDLNEVVVGFFPLYRLSKRLLDGIHIEYKRGWNGHYEVTWGTIAKRYGYEIEDFGGSGPYTKPHNKHVFYFANMNRWDKNPGTFVFRPKISRIRKKENTLWHPVKPRSDFFDHCPAKEQNNLYGWMKFVTKYVWYELAITVWFMFCWRPAKSSPDIPGLGPSQLQSFRRRTSARSQW
jgi:hypothetical protein